MTDPCSIGSVFIATSLDGFIARSDGSIDWLEQAQQNVPAGEDCGYADFMAGVDALVMGRHTFATVRAFAAWPYGPKPVIVLSRSLRELPSGTPATVSLSSAPPAELVRRLREQGLTRLYIDGGQTIQHFLAAGLIQQLTITVIPILLGQGRPLFGPLPAEVKLAPVSSRLYPFGFVQTHYHVRGPA